VENAYVQLHRDGFIVRREGSGSYVCEAIGTELRGASRRRQAKRSKAARRRRAPA
jgi:GntR family transcriptional regulator/MocR family aminotransferase